MPTTPILGIAQVTTSQNGKEVTINDAILALENATNGNKIVSFAAGVSVTLTATEATRSFIYRAQAATAACILNFPIAINGNPYNRLFVVRNESGFGLTVKFASGAGPTVAVPNGQSRLIAAINGTDMVVAAEPSTNASFLSLSDSPDSYATFHGKVLAVNDAENSLEFIDVANFPSLVGNATKILAVKADLSGVEWVAYDANVSFLDLVDSPDAYTGQAGKLVAVKASSDGVEFIDPPAPEAVEFNLSDKWRILVTAPGTETQVGFGEVEWQNVSRIDQTTGGTPEASTFATGKEPSFAFDGNTTAGAGWLSDAAYAGAITLDYTFTTAFKARYLKVWPITGFPSFSPLAFTIQRWNGAAWIDAGECRPTAWVSGVPQTFSVLGSALSSIPDAPNDGQTYGRRNAAWETIDERVRDVIGAALAGGVGVTITPNDAGDTITITATFDAEMARDTLAAAMVAGAGITITPNDGADTITIASTITQYTNENAMDAIAAMLTAGTGINLVYNDAGDVLTISSTGGYTNENAMDAIAAMLTAGTGITLVYNDAGDTLTVTSTITQYTNEMAMDAIAAMLVAGSGINLVYNDAGDTLTISSTGGYTNENAMDAIAAMLTAGTGVSLVYNDAGDTLTIKVTTPYNIPFAFTTTPTSNEIMLLHVFTESVQLADDFAGSVKSVGTNPTATFVLSVSKNATVVGTISIATNGVVTFVTTGTTVDFVSGDLLTITAQGTADTTIANVAITLKGTRP